ncbi:MAG: hypothetical protein AB1714_31335 [Acidobacteriota bacterium]
MDAVALSGADRTDATLQYIRTLYMPSVPPKVQAVLMFQMSPAEMKIVPEPPAATPSAPATTAATPATPAAPAAPAAPAVPAAPANVVVDVFFRLTKADNTGTYVPCDDMDFIYREPADQATGSAMYTVSLTLDPGSYKFIMAISDEKLQKIATARSDFVLPDIHTSTGKLETTPIIFTKSVKQFDASGVERTAQIHKGVFKFAILEIEPNMENVFKAGDSKEIFYFVSGGKPDLASQPPRFDFEVTYTLKMDKETYIKFARQTFTAPLINHQLPLVAQGKPLTPGFYTLQVEVQDKIGGNRLKTEVPIEIQ